MLHKKLLLQQQTYQTYLRVCHYFGKRQTCNFVPSCHLPFEIMTHVFSKKSISSLFPLLWCSVGQLQQHAQHFLQSTALLSLQFPPPRRISIERWRRRQRRTRSGDSHTALLCTHIYLCSGTSSCPTEMITGSALTSYMGLESDFSTFLSVMGFSSFI